MYNLYSMLLAVYEILIKKTHREVLNSIVYSDCVLCFVIFVMFVIAVICV